MNEASNLYRRQATSKSGFNAVARQAPRIGLQNVLLRTYIWIWIAQQVALANLSAFQASTAKFGMYLY